MLRHNLMILRYPLFFFPSSFPIVDLSVLSQVISKNVCVEIFLQLFIAPNVTYYVILFCFPRVYKNSHYWQYDTCRLAKRLKLGAVSLRFTTCASL